MAENKGIGLTQTKGTFQLRGIVTGVEKEKFYTELVTKSGKPMRMLNFGVTYDTGKTVYVSLSGMERDAVYFSKSEMIDGKRTNEMEKVPWKDRKTFKKEGFSMLGVRCGIEQELDGKGNNVNKKATLVEYDACKYIADNISDGDSVFIGGTIEHSTYNDKHQTKFVIGQIYHCTKPVDFTAEGYETANQFTQTIVIGSVAKEENSFTVNGKIIGYSSVEEADFICENPKLAANLKKLKPYTAIQVFGDIRVEREEEEVEEDDGWGTPNKMGSLSAPVQRKLVITGANKDSIDTDTYNEKNINAATAKANAKKNADKDYGKPDDDDWGSAPTASDIDDDDDIWE